MTNQLCLLRLKVQVKEIIKGITSRPTSEDDQTNRFNRMQYRYFLMILGDIDDSICRGVELSERVKNMLESWSQDEDRGHYFLDFCYGFRTKQYTFAKGA